jgi:hypothetical protein
MCSSLEQAQQVLEQPSDLLRFNMMIGCSLIDIMRLVFFAVLYVHQKLTLGVKNKKMVTTGLGARSN